MEKAGDMKDIEVLYIDNHVLVLNKPAGLATQTSETHSESLEDNAREWIKTEFDRKGNVFLHALHRLDTPVSGAVLFARTDKALSRLNQSMRDRKHKKVYLAVVEGVPKLKEAKLKHYHSHERFRAKITPMEHEGSKEAVLSYKCVQSLNGISILEVELDTGRYHQIRAQLSHVGMPIFGDEKYRSTRNMDNGIIALHHVSLSFLHPVTKEMITVKAPIPEYYPFNLFNADYLNY